MEFENGIIDDVQTQKVLQSERERWRKSLGLREGQGLYFSSIVYGKPVAVFENEADTRYLYSKTALCFSAIANDRLFKNHIAAGYKLLDSLKFPDHKTFSKSDMKLVSGMSAKYPLAALFTTEKDCKRLTSCGFVDKEVKKRLFYIPIETEILLEKERKAFFDSLL